MGKLKVAADGLFPGVPDLSIEIAHLRANLTQTEGNVSGPWAGSALKPWIPLSIPCTPVRPNSRSLVSWLANLSAAVYSQPSILIATDERIFNFRHPLPTAKKLERYAMLILCGRQHGLVCSITRLVHFGHLPEEIQKKAHICSSN